MISKGWEYVRGCSCPACKAAEPIMPPMVPKLSAQRMVDEFGFPLPKKEEISVEDLILVKGFLGNLKDQTLSRSTHRVLQDLLGRL